MAHRAEIDQQLHEFVKHHERPNGTLEKDAENLSVVLFELDAEDKYDRRHQVELRDETLHYKAFNNNQSRDEHHTGIWLAGYEEGLGGVRDNPKQDKFY